MASLALLLLVCAIAPTSAMALSAQVTAPAAPVPEDIPTQITIAGDGGADGRLYVTFRDNGGIPCAANYKNDTGASLIDGRTAVGTFTQTTSRTFSAPGQQLICIWIQKTGSDETPLYASKAVLTIRQPNTTIALTPPGTSPPNTSVQLTIGYQAEVERRVYVAIQRAGGSGCATTYKNDPGTGLLDGRTINGGPSTTTQSFTTGNPGTYLLCAYVQEFGGEEAAEVATSAMFKVPKIRTSISLRARKFPGGFTLSGAVSRRAYGPVVFERRSGRRWKRVTSTSVSGGEFSVNVYRRKRTKVKLRARYLGNEVYTKSSSRTVSTRPGR